MYRDIYIDWGLSIWLEKGIGLDQKCWPKGLYCTNVFYHRFGADTLFDMNVLLVTVAFDLSLSNLLSPILSVMGVAAMMLSNSSSSSPLSESGSASESTFVFPLGC